MVQVEVTLSEWIYNALIGKEVLTINRDYFRLRKTLERRVYELARKHCGSQKQWVVGLDILHQKSGSLSELKKFRFQMRQIIGDDQEHNHFPDYRIVLDDRDMVTVISKKENQDVTFEDLPSLSPVTLEKAREITRKAGKEGDFYALQNEFTLALINGFSPDKADGAFINFIKKKIAKSS